MFRCFLVCLTVVIVGLGSADAQHRRQIDATPFAHAPCSVFDREPCTPQDQAEKYRKPDHDLDTIGDLFAALRSCWAPPPADTAREGMQMSVRFSFKKTGEIIATPQVTYATAGVPADTRATYLKAINESLTACMPLKFTGGLGGALAGRPIAIRYVDNRDLGRQAGKP
jgi:hypothetical protein